MKVRTIQNLLKYNFNRKERRYLMSLWITNWCWWKWWPNFSKKIRETLEELESYNPKKALKLLADVERLCEEHDVKFELWGNKRDFIKANVSFSYGLFKLIHWGSIIQRIWVFTLAYVLLNRFWKKYFSFWKKLELETLFKKFNLNSKNYDNIWNNGSDKYGKR